MVIFSASHTSPDIALASKPAIERDHGLPGITLSER